MAKILDFQTGKRRKDLETIAKITSMQKEEGELWTSFLVRVLYSMEITPNKFNDPLVNDYAGFGYTDGSGYNFEIQRYFTYERQGLDILKSLDISTCLDDIPDKMLPFFNETIVIQTKPQGAILEISFEGGLARFKYRDENKFPVYGNNKIHNQNKTMDAKEAVFEIAHIIGKSYHEASLRQVDSR